MNVLDIAKKRYSVRTYEDKPVEKEKLEKILASAHVAPTAANLQPVKLLVVQDKERLKSIAKAGNIYNAPLAIIVCADHSKAWTRPFDIRFGLIVALYAHIAFRQSLQVALKCSAAQFVTCRRELLVQIRRGNFSVQRDSLQNL